jgi:hypothetical protein
VAAAVPPSAASDICFNVLALEAQSGNDALDWAGFRPLAFPNAVRPAGMNLVGVPLEYAVDMPVDGLEDAGMPFKVLSNQEYVYLFRQVRKGTLLVNRFRLVRETMPGNPQEVFYSLAPAWEVRFQRSGKPDTAADAKDIQSHLDPDEHPFIEPAFELLWWATWSTATSTSSSCRRTRRLPGLPGGGARHHPAGSWLPPAARSPWAARPRRRGSARTAHPAGLFPS